MTTENADRKKARGGARPGAGRKPFEFSEKDRNQVETLSGYGLPLEQIAVLIGDGISVESLVKHFPKELTIGKARANSAVSKTLFQKAVGGDTGAMVWWSKSQMRWAETQKHEVTGKDGGPVAVAQMDLKGLSDAELETVHALIQKAVANG